MAAQLYWIPGINPGRLAIMPRPRGGDWLESDLKAWKTAGVDRVVSLLAPSEMVELELLREAQTCDYVGLRYLSYTIPDFQVPRSISATTALIQEIDSWLKAGQSVVIHCRAGIGRSSTIAACVLALRGLTAVRAFEIITAARGLKVPDTDEQRQWVEHFVKQLHLP